MFASPLKNDHLPVPLSSGKKRHSHKKSVPTEDIQKHKDTRKLKKSVVDEVRQRFEARKAKSDSQYPDLNNNLGFI